MQITEKLRTLPSALLGATIVAAGLVAGLITTTSTATAAPPKLPISIKPEIVKNELLIRLKSGAGQDEISAIAKELDATVVKSAKGLNIYLLRTTTDMTVKAAENKLAAAIRTESLPGKIPGKIAYIQPNFVYHTMDNTPNDPYLYLQWSMYNYGQFYGSTAGADVKALPAWDLSTGSSSVYVADIDTGIDYTHPDLVNNCWVNPDEIPGNGMDDDGNGYVDDVYGINACDDPYGDFPYYLPGDPFDDGAHGTHTAGTIGASGNNGTGVVGVNWNVKIIALKFLNGFGYGYTSDAVECLDYMHYLKTVKGINIVASNNSWGGGGYDQALYDAIQQSGNDGVLFIAAAGNGYGSNNDVNPTYPATYGLSNIISVAATDFNDKLATFSNIGKNTVDLGAPGDSILSTVPTWYAYFGYDIYQFFSGTSMATPHVTGAAALLHSYDASLTAAQIKTRIVTTGDLNAALKNKTISGKRLNLYNLLTNTVPIPPPPTYKLKVAITTDSSYYYVGQLYTYKVAVTMDGDPVSNAKVDIKVSYPGGSYSQTKTTGASGLIIYSKKALVAGTYTVTAKATKTNKTATDAKTFDVY